ncbi:sigma-70 family RNA polymerase sigma factor [Janthinobacterium lividum]|uniref:sigma-70 family RNA polymerase sigma factor n=1 Tax=Janthinobacterium lividum TaxID=29581 RepID=UPI00068B21BB|nr:sigma-70 family RNA polymerase sigma factor [Janthinobacterium lividum]
MIAAPVSADPHGSTITVLYSEHHGWLKTWLQRKLGCSFDAADLAHDTFVRIVTGYRTGKQGAAVPMREPRAYLRTVANGLMIDLFRRRSLEQAWLAALAGQPDVVAISPEERLLVLEALQRLDAMLDAMPAKVRSVFLLSQLEGLTYPQIVERLGIPLRTVKRYMQQGFAQCLSLML